MHKNWHQKLAMFSFSHGCGRSQSHLVQTEINTTLVQYNILGTLKSDSFRSKNCGRIYTNSSCTIQHSGDDEIKQLQQQILWSYLHKDQESKMPRLTSRLTLWHQTNQHTFLGDSKLKNWPGSNLLHETTLPKLLISLYFIVFSPLSLKHFTASSAV